MLEQLRQTIQEYRLIEPGERIILGFSGGVDSLSLLHALRSLTELRLELWAVYINHSLRPAENRLEEALLREVGARFGVRTQEFVIDVPGRLREKPQSLQLFAREERYRIFREFQKEIGAAKVALAHHRDDQVETVLYRFLRGTGLDGLAGIPVRRDGIFIRPLLEVSRRQILEYARLNGLEWIEDSSNKKTVYRRNRIRLELLPQLETEYNPRLREAVVRLADLAGEHRQYMEAEVERLAPAVAVRDGERLGIRLAAFLELHPYLQYYFLKKMIGAAGSERPIESAPLLRLRERLNREGTAFKRGDLLKGVSAYLENGVVFLGTAPAALPFDGRVSPVAAPGRTALGDGRELWIESGRLPQNVSIPKDEIYVDPAKLRLPLRVRFWRPGDAFRPFGAPGTQKLHDFFINQKLARAQRTRIPLLVTADDRIVWVIGYRAADDFKVDDRQAMVWRIAIKPLRNG
jgi:tRNA(Ile)-lysidine synthase